VVEEEPDVTDAREAVLDRIRSIQRAEPPTFPRGYRRSGALTAEERARLLAERIADYHATVRETAAGEVGAAIASACADHGVTRLGLPSGFPGEWRPDGPELVEDHGLSPRELDPLDGVATGCSVAIAETGTIVLAAGPAEGRRALTLVPDLHICVIRAEQIVELVPEAIALLSPLVVQERRPLTFVSGPSATSDIGFSRVEGVHGPRTLVALIVTEEKQ
jgi:L-lactate dehydrogenase complex protein LldG